MDGEPTGWCPSPACVTIDRRVFSHSLYFMPPRLLTAVLLAFVLLAGPSCGGVVGPSQNTIDQFSGFIDPLGDAQHDFSVSRNGEFSVRFLGFEPAGAILQVIFAQFVGGACQQVIGASFGGQNTTVLTGAISPGQYCIVVFDEGLIAQRVTYSVQVSHP
jgi:hypothetical protein